MAPRRLILGLGNDILGDDGVGLRVVETLRERPSLADFDFATAEGAGLVLLDVLLGYDQAFIVDCIPARHEPVGKVRRIGADEVASLSQCVSSHYMGLPDVLALGRRIGLPLPQVEVLAITVKDPYCIGSGLSRALRRALPAIVAQVERAILEGHKENKRL